MCINNPIIFLARDAKKRGGRLYLVHCYQFPLEMVYGAIISYVNRLWDNWKNVWAIYYDKTDVGEYIIKDMQ